MSDYNRRNDQPSEEGPFDKYPYRVVVKFQDELDEPPIEKLASVLNERFGDISTSPWLDNQAIQTVIQLQREAVELDLDGGYMPVNFRNYVIVTLPLYQEPEEVVRFVRQWDYEVSGNSEDRLVEYVYTRPKPALPPALTPDDEDNIGDQGYIEPHNTIGPALTFGVDARYAWETYGDDGGDGQDVNFIDLEQGWYLNHVDLPSAPLIPIVHGNSFEDTSTDIPLIQQHRAHGTRSIGIVVAADNEARIMGMAPHATAAVVSSWYDKNPPTGDYEHDIAKAIYAATLNLGFGDVLLIEEQLETDEPDKHDPVELDPLNFDAIRLATALGIVVIEPAANGANQPGDNPTDGAYNLDNRPQHDSAPPLMTLDRSGPDFKDSHAIMVAGATKGFPHRLMEPSSPTECIVLPKPSNYGSRVDCFAWGQCVFTIGREDGDPDGVTARFNGTSSASAIVAGTAVLMQAIAEKHTNVGERYTPVQLRNILSDPVRNTSSPDSAVIGYMPNLGRLIPHYIEGTPVSDVYVRDNLTDNGEPHSGSISASPDVIVQAGPATPAAFSDPATINSNTLGSTVLLDQDHFVYVRALNRGASATNVRADVYYTPPITLQSPDEWRYIGSTPAGTNVPSDTMPPSITVLDPIPWPAADLPPDDDGFDHYCFIAAIYSDDDPNVLPAPANIDQLVLNNIDDFYRLVRANNNVTWRNFNVVEMSMAALTYQFPFLAAGWPNQPLEMALEINAHLPDGAIVWLDGPTAFMSAVVRDKSELRVGQEDGRRRVPLNPRTPNRLRTVQFPAKFKGRMQLIVELPEGQKERAYEIFARQLYQGEEVGRITWYLVPPRLKQK